MFRLLRLCFLLIWLDRGYVRECLYLKARKSPLPTTQYWSIRKDLWTYLRRQYGKRDSSRCTRVCTHPITQLTHTRPHFNTGMASPLLGIAGVNSLLFASYGISKRIISPYPLSLKEIAVAGAMAGAANAILASPGSAFPTPPLRT